ncbi:phage protein D [Sphingomonas kyeonggiensis]|uniref:contractile injection system protein, VgrG/Pvc8 family n=1 Tax=Sphingomonas kyeonggiensis TaxID=1268553 RepID=UPI0027819ED0|nr:contractile injection system protein, VgrG/Pvc8 family [Sphingomonas kyeonggiensis]MDQ0250949.1 phage protein D [Sphingomonas kyeonggiensis]
MTRRADFRLTLAGSDLAGDIFAAAAELVDITDKVRPRLVSLRLTSKRGGEADQLDLVLDDSDGMLAIPPSGAVIRLQLGIKGEGLVDKGAFKVDEPEWSIPSDQISVRARAADLTAGFRVRTERSWKGTTLGAIVRELAGANGLDPRIDPDLAGIPVPTLVQHNTSDMALLRRLGKDHDAVATVKDGKLLFSRIGKGTTASGKALPGLTLTRPDVSSCRVRFTARGADAGVEARWHDQDAGERKTVKAGGGAGKPKRLRKVYHSEAAAQQAAQAENGRTKRAGASASIELSDPRPDLYPERNVTLQGFKPGVDGSNWILSEVSHSLDKSGGLRTSLTLEAKG